jgi:hypothetical protein
MTSQQFEALQKVIVQAVADSEDYQTYGNPHVDYGDEWPETARAKAENWRVIADWFQSGGGRAGLIDQCARLARALESSAAEYESARH